MTQMMLVLTVSALFLCSFSSSDSICPSGQFFDPESQCKPCDPGSYCNGNQSALCEKGFFQDKSEMDHCFPCPTGTHQPEEGQTGCRDCIPGMFCHNQTHAEPCPPGSVQPLKNQEFCTPCTAGTYRSSEGGILCDPCPTGHFCPEGSDAPIPCGTGQFSPSVSAVQCQDCPIGSYQPNNGSKSCDPCPVGNDCSDRTSSWLCPAGHFLYQGRCTRCSNGYYQPTAGLNKCIACPVGHYCPDPARDPIPCPIGQVASKLGSTRCSSCSSGSVTNGTGSSSCQQCRVGHYCNGKIERPCAPGTYQTIANQKACLACPSGTYQDMAGSVNCSQCTAGHKCGAGSVTPEPCSSGTYQPYGSKSSCIGCPPGHFCPDPKTEPLPCAPGTYQDDVNRTGCLLCPDGSFSIQSASSSCKPCPRGSFCLKPAEPPMECPAGRYQPSQNQSVCLDCPTGTFQVKPGGAECQICPANFSCLNPALEPIKCPQGTMQPAEGSIECISIEALPTEADSVIEGGEFCFLGEYKIETKLKGYCLACPKGHYCPGNATLPIPCPPGNYSDVRNSSQCKTCAMGSYQPTSGTASCYPCSRGYQCPSGLDTIPIRCVPGTYWDSKKWLCHDCQPGYFAERYGQSECNSCPQGHQCPFTRMKHPLVCPAGSYQYNSKQTSCNSCNKGYYTNREGMVRCLKCPNGYSCEDSIHPIPVPPGHYVSPNRPCKAGTYQPLAGQTHCLSCPPGYFCPEGSINPEHCAQGTYTDRTGRSSCSTCTAGNSCQHGRRIACLPGTYSTGGSLDCEPCPEGQYSGTAARSCTACPRGSKCLDAAELPQLCPAGTYQDSQGQTSCKAVPEGAYQLDLGSSRYKTCPSGHSCITPTADPNPCGPGTYQDSAGQTSSKPANPGSYAAGYASRGSKPAPQGSFAPGYGNDKPYSCPAGTCVHCSNHQSCSPCKPNRDCPERVGQSTNGQACPPDPGTKCLNAVGSCAMSTLTHGLSDLVEAGYNMYTDPSAENLADLMGAATGFDYKGAARTAKWSYGKLKNSLNPHRLRPDVKRAGKQNDMFLPDVNDEIAQKWKTCYDALLKSNSYGLDIWDQDFATRGYAAITEIKAALPCLGTEPNNRRQKRSAAKVGKMLWETAKCSAQAPSCVSYAINAVSSAIHGSRSKRSTTANDQLQQLAQNQLAFTLPILKFMKENDKIGEMLAMVDDETCFPAIEKSISIWSGDGKRTISDKEMKEIESSCNHIVATDSMGQLREAVKLLNTSFDRLTRKFLAGTFLEPYYRSQIDVSGHANAKLSVTVSQASAYLKQVQQILRVHSPVWTKLEQDSALSVNWFAVQPSLPDDFKGVSFTNLTDFKEQVGNELCEYMAAVIDVLPSADVQNSTLFYSQTDGSVLVQGLVDDTMALEPLFVVACQKRNTPTVSDKK